MADEIKAAEDIAEKIGGVTARFKDGMPIEEIAEKSEISVDEVKKILKDKKLI